MNQYVQESERSNAVEWDVLQRRVADLEEEKERLTAERDEALEVANAQVALKAAVVVERDALRQKLERYERLGEALMMQVRYFARSGHRENFPHVKPSAHEIEADEALQAWRLRDAEGAQG